MNVMVLTNEYVSARGGATCAERNSTQDNFGDHLEQPCVVADSHGNV